ncbi:MAG: FkbM family methyltransferase [Bacteroidota bacterium]
MQFLYRIVYFPPINVVLRTINKWIKPILPAGFTLPPSGKITFRLRDHKTLRLKTNPTNYLTQRLFWEGPEQFEYTTIFMSLIQKMDVFFDVGAHAGYYSLLAGLYNPDCKVISFEPASGPKHFFKENIALNNTRNIHLETIALSHQEGEITFYEIRNKKYRYLKYNLAGEGNTGSLTEGRNYHPIVVPTTTLDQYVAQHNVETIDLMKMDTEGTEYLILEHADKVLGEFQPILIIETLFGVREAEMEKVLKKYGYDFYSHTPKGLVKTVTLVRTEPNGVDNCFMVHPSKVHLIQDYLA